MHKVGLMIGFNKRFRPQVYKGAERGYYFGGSFSGRVPVKSDPLVSIQPPRLSVGCGGIDVFTGSFSMLNPEYLVQKAERVLESAPFTAFMAVTDLFYPKIDLFVLKIRPF